jgi:F0F1-type ATP synthase assembly protein I
LPDSEDPHSTSENDRLVALDQSVKDALAKREAEAKARADRAEQAAAARTAGAAWRIMIDLVAAVAVVGIIGYGADRLFGTLPLGLLAGLFFGFAIGMWRAMTAANRLSAQPAPPASGANGPDGS